MNIDNLTLRQAFDQHCFDCTYDEKASGGKRQQIALCTVKDCKKYFKRPMPRNCRKNGKPDLEAIAKLKVELDGRDKRKD